MQPYEQLKKAYTIQVTENQAFVHENFNIASKLVSNLITFLDLPSTPKTPDTPPILQFLRPKLEGGFAPVAQLEEAVLSFPEGKFQFGLGLLLETDGELQSNRSQHLPITATVQAIRSQFLCWVRHLICHSPPQMLWRLAKFLNLYSKNFSRA